MAKVRVRMNICDFVHDVEVTMNDEGGFDVHIDSECPKVLAYAESLGTLEMMDLVDKMGSRIFITMMANNMSATCLTPSGVMSAGWIEAGLWARSRAKEKGDNRIEFIIE